MLATPEWLAALKPGDFVAVDVSKYSYTDYVKGTVVRLTPKQVEVQAHYPAPIKFRKDDGSEVGGDKYHRMSIGPITPDVEAHWRRKKALARVERVNWASLPTEVLEAVVAALPPLK